MSMKIITAATMLLAGSAWAQEVHVFPVQGNVSMIVGPGGNTTVQQLIERLTGSALSNATSDLSASGYASKGDLSGEI